MQSDFDDLQHFALQHDRGFLNIRDIHDIAFDGRQSQSIKFIFIFTRINFDMVGFFDKRSRWNIYRNCRRSGQDSVGLLLANLSRLFRNVNPLTVPKQYLLGRRVGFTDAEHPVVYLETEHAFQPGPGHFGPQPE